MKLMGAFIIMCGVCMLLLCSGCGKKVAKIDPGPPMANTGMGATVGTCAVCKKQSDHLLTTSADTYTATVCSKECGDKFRAMPAFYGKPITTTPGAPAAPPPASPSIPPPPAPTSGM